MEVRQHSDWIRRPAQSESLAVRIAVLILTSTLDPADVRGCLDALPVASAPPVCTYLASVVGYPKYLSRRCHWVLAGTGSRR